MLLRSGCRSHVKYGEFKKVRRMSRPTGKETFHAPEREPLPRRSATATRGPRCCSGSCACACRLGTRGPVTKPSIVRPAGGILEALISVLYRPSMEGVSLCCSHHGSKRGQGRYRHHKLAHCSLPLKFSGDETTLDCINFALIRYFYNMSMSTVQ
jgi:hypothetical protein